ncbi:unnamed protein product [Zymoseptoria tritici ST99CH_3D7]|uniref:Exonuclease domain-containing protein n=1 Tax=Zymoseptoria tritici (strain ST99CH_3D7) TaxID=1276538 RepID=A0A1X7S3D2_ZYMT9|nr:unnamed protein product [Zymoseptoria tritici ST99CH_3D7]
MASLRAVRTVKSDDIVFDANGKPQLRHGLAHTTRRTTRALQPQPRWDLVTEYMALDVEFQMENDHSTGRNRQKPGRVSMTNSDGKIVYDVFVYFPSKKGHHYWRNSRAQNFGCYNADVKPSNGARPIAEVEENVHNLFANSVAVGHAVLNDLEIWESWVFNGVAYRDTQKIAKYQQFALAAKDPSLSRLAMFVLNRPFRSEGGEHSSVEDAQATMELYLLGEPECEIEQANWYYHSNVTAEYYEEDSAEMNEAPHEENSPQEAVVGELDAEVDGPPEHSKRVGNTPFPAVQLPPAFTTWQARSAHVKANLHASNKTCSQSKLGDALTFASQSGASSPSTIAGPISTQHPSGEASNTQALGVPTEQYPDTHAVPASSTISMSTVPIASTTASLATYAEAKAKAAIKIACPRVRQAAANPHPHAKSATNSIPIVAPTATYAHVAASGLAGSHHPELSRKMAKL